MQQSASWICKSKSDLLTRSNSLPQAIKAEPPSAMTSFAVESRLLPYEVIMGGIALAVPLYAMDVVAKMKTPSLLRLGVSDLVGQ